MKVNKGAPKPLGLSAIKDKINFALFSKNAEKVTLIIELNGETFKFQLDPKANRTGDIWHICIQGLQAPFAYSYLLDGPHNGPHYFHPHKSLTDPYAKTINTTNIWGDRTKNYSPKGMFVEAKSFDWENISAPKHSVNELIIYEMHVRGFTQHPSSNVKRPGTFLGIIEKIPYLKDLGINAIELMPVQEFNECEYSRISKITKKPLCNYFGYSTVNYFCPMNRYAVDPKNSVNEFKMLVKELHRNGIEVILDIVFNHTGEKEKNIYSFMGIDHSVYYLLKDGHHLNYSGCGHTTNLNHPILRQFIKDVLHYWVVEMHVDGFRFDLASIMNRDTKGNLLHVSPLIEELSLDPVLSQTKLIAEPWDIGAYQLGGFYPEKSRWSEWNGRFRDAVRRFMKGDPYSKNEFAGRISGSADIFPARKPSASINFITCHDGFTLHDLVSYNHKHNELNSEQNKDGANENFSWNMGHEGETSDDSIINIRNRQIKNFIVALFISKGVPMILMGDEYGHTKKGNNNTWCQDNELNWFIWEKESPLYSFMKNMISFRKEHSILQKDTFYEGSEIIWHGLNKKDPNWEEKSPILAFTIKKENKKLLYVAFNATHKSINFALPTLDKKNKWYLVVDTNNPPPHDFFTKGNERLIEEDQYLLAPYSSIIMKVKT